MESFIFWRPNTQPGMTNLSLVPEIALYHGMNFFSLIDWIIKDASKKQIRKNIFFFISSFF